MEYGIVLTTVNSSLNGKAIAKALINNNLAACVNMIANIQSFYKWNNEFYEDNEYLLIIKTTKKLFEKVKDVIIKNHEYELPEVIFLDINKGSEKYLKWIKEQTCTF